MENININFGNHKTPNAVEDYIYFFENLRQPFLRMMWSQKH
jgi:hypothetical protein